MTTQHYVDADVYRSTLARIVNTLTGPGHDPHGAIVEILGEAGIWPSYCRPANPTLHVIARGLNTLETPSLISLANAKAA